MTSEEIKLALKAKKYTQPMIASELEKSQPAIHLVIEKKSVSKKIQDHICGILGKTFKEVWG